MMRSLLSVLLISVVFPSYAQQCERIIQVGAWNIQWLGNAEAGKREPQTPEDVASYIAAAKVDILGLEEITATTGATGLARNTTLDASFKLLSSSGAKWQYRLFKKRKGARAPLDQWTGIAWNSAAVERSGGPWRLNVKVSAARENAIGMKFDPPASSTAVLSRWPYATKFSAGPGKSDFVIVPLHLKSNIGGAATSEARAYEAELVVAGLKKLKPVHKDNDIVIVGDSNMLVSSEPAGKALAGGGFIDCNARDLATHLPFSAGDEGAPFDRVFLMSDQPETANSCPAHGNDGGPLAFNVVLPGDWIPGLSNAEFRRRLSDHLLVRVGVCVLKDDD